MKIALATVDLLSGREKLMPWRTIIEVAKYIEKKEYSVDILTLSVSSLNEDYTFKNIQIKSIPRDFSVFCSYIESNNYDALVYPMPWREGLKNISAFASLNCIKVAYFPGGSYHLSNIIQLWKNVGLRTAKPYLIDWITPYWLLMSKLSKMQFKTVIAQSPYTAQTCMRGGFGNVQMIVPGKDDFDELKDDDTIFERLNIKQKKYFLFSGAPAPIRGAAFLLKAIDKLAEKDSSIFCLFLMRRDITSDYRDFDMAYKNMKHKENIQILDVRVNRNELKTIMSKAHGVILPFLLVPSEIPITFFEVMSLGVPIVTFMNGGTTDYLGENVLSSPVGDINMFLDNLYKLWNNDTVHDVMSKKALDFMKKHPYWDEVGERWLKAIIE